MLFTKTAYILWIYRQNLKHYTFITFVQTPTLEVFETGVSNYVIKQLQTSYKIHNLSLEFAQIKYVTLTFYYQIICNIELCNV